jgi:hypothetical protein
MKIGLLGAGLLNADKVTDGQTYDEADSRFFFLHFCERT